MRQVHEHCKKIGLEIPYFSEEDLDKILWRLIKEQSLTLANLQPHVIITQSPLFNQETLVSGSLETFGGDNFDLKNILISENDNLTPITGLLLKFPAQRPAIINQVELPPDPSGWQAAEFYSVLRTFNKNWRDDILMDIAETDKTGKFIHILKASNSNPAKLELLKKELEIMNCKLIEELGVKVNYSTKYAADTPIDQVLDKEDNNKLFFTGKKNHLLFMMQALQSFVDQEFKDLSDATFTLDNVGQFD